MSEYVLFIYDDEAKRDAAGVQVHDALLREHDEFTVRHASALRGGHRLYPSSAATSVRSDGSDGVSVSDGAFGETKEVIGGFYLIDAADLDEALAIAKQVPAPFGGVEVRPVWPVE